MSGAVQIVVTGADDVARRLGALDRDANDLQGVFGAIANVIAADARSLAPKVTGRLAASVTPSSTKHGGGVTTRLVYSGAINYGWRRRGIEPTRFMNQAADSKGDKAAADIRAELRRLISRNGLG